MGGFPAKSSQRRAGVPPVEASGVAGRNLPSGVSEANRRLLCDLRHVAWRRKGFLCGAPLPRNRKDPVPPPNLRFGSPQSVVDPVPPLIVSLTPLYPYPPTPLLLDAIANNAKQNLKTPIHPKRTGYLLNQDGLYRKTLAEKLSCYTQQTRQK